MFCLSSFKKRERFEAARFKVAACGLKLNYHRHLNNRLRLNSFIHQTKSSSVESISSNSMNFWTNFPSKWPVLTLRLTRIWIHHPIKTEAWIWLEINQRCLGFLILTFPGIVTCFWNYDLLIWSGLSLSLFFFLFLFFLYLKAPFDVSCGEAHAAPKWPMPHKV